MACAFSIWTFLWAFTRGKSKYIFRDFICKRRGFIDAPTAAGYFSPRPKALLMAETLCLRQQLVVVPQRRHPRPRLLDADRRRGH
jgi:hypothetical protein